MSCCNHFRDFLVLSSADLTRLTLVDAASCPAPGCQQITKHTKSCPPGRNCQTVLSQSRPRIVFENAAAASASSCCCFRFDLLLRNFSSPFFASFFSQTHTNTRTSTEKRNDEVISLFAWISYFLRFLLSSLYSLLRNCCCRRGFPTGPWTGCCDLTPGSFSVPPRTKLGCSGK